MKEQALPYERIVFVCTNQRGKDERCSCGAKGAAIQEALKDWVKKSGLKGRVRVSKSGCMDKCELGPNVMIFPENTWFSNVKERDLPEICARLLAPPPPEDAAE